MIDCFRKDNTDNGICIECGECCGTLLPLREKEIAKIKRYIKRHKIKPIKHDADYCPFLDATKETHKCNVYEVRPHICRDFKCDKKFPKHKLNADGIYDMKELFLS